MKLGSLLILALAHYKTHYRESIKMNIDKQAKMYLLEAMREHLEGYDFTESDIAAMDNHEISDQTRWIFINEYQWQLERKGVIGALTDWLQGLALPIDYSYYDIIQRAKDWGSIPDNATKKQEEDICNNYWSFMANKLSQLFDGYHVPKEVTQ
jgi:hypothetical protein